MGGGVGGLLEISQALAATKPNDEEEFSTRSSCGEEAVFASLGPAKPSGMQKQQMTRRAFFFTKPSAYFFFAGFFSLLSFESLEAPSLLADSFSLFPASCVSVAGLSALSPSLAPGFFPP